MRENGFWLETSHRHISQGSQSNLLMFSYSLVLTGLQLFFPLTISTYQEFKIWSREGEGKNETPLWPHLELSPLAILFSITVPTWKCSRSTEVLEWEPRLWTSWISRHIREFLEGQPARRAEPRSCLGGVPVHLMTFLSSGHVSETILC